jgi:alpha-N-arabinofuranosidase
MAAYTAFISNLAFDGNDATLSPVGLVFKLYRKHFGTLPVEVSGSAPQKPIKGTVGVDKPSISSGSDTYPLDVAAALTTDKKKLTLAIVNPTETVHEMDLGVTGAQLLGTGTMWRIAAPNLDADNEPGKEPALEIRETRLTERPATLALPPLSVSLIELDVR